ncbi:MAG TPA: hypothetical protein VMF57_14235 [Solirubrobacteraceae bacterium]|nr:hypothetical protein [Solirubrobacteraceae bacterium]
MSALGTFSASGPGVFGLGGSAPTGAVDPFGGQTPYGFSIPQGDSGELQLASRSCADRAMGLDSQVMYVTNGARTALGGWRGQAEAAFLDYSGTLVRALHANSDAFARASQVLSSFAGELEHAQAVTKEALAQCQLYHGQMTTALGRQTEQGQTAQTLEQQAANAFHPQMQTELSRQAGIARGEAAAAGDAATKARTEFEAWQKRGNDADQTYQHQAQSASRELHAAAEQLEVVARLPGGAPVPINISPGDITLAQSMMAAAGSLPAAAKAMSDPAELERLADGRLTPGALVAFTDYGRAEAEAAAKEPKGNLIDGLGGFVHTASLGLFSFGNSDTQRYQGGELAAMIPVDPDALVVDGERVTASVVEDHGLLTTIVDGRPFEVSIGDEVPLSSRPVEGRVVQRVYGQPADDTGLVPTDDYSRPGGHSWTPVSPTSYDDPRDSLGLPDANGGRFVITGKIVDSDGIVARHAIPLDGTSGGGLEYLVPDPKGQIEIISVGGQNPPF